MLTAPETLGAAGAMLHEITAPTAPGAGGAIRVPGIGAWQPSTPAARAALEAAAAPRYDYLAARGPDGRRGPVAGANDNGRRMVGYGVIRTLLDHPAMPDRSVGTTADLQALAATLDEILPIRRPNSADPAPPATPDESPPPPR